MVITQEPTQSLTALHVPGAADACIAGEQQDVVLPLMIALSMVMLDVFAQGAPQGALAEEDYLGQALLLYRPDPALHIRRNGARGVLGIAARCLVGLRATAAHKKFRVHRWWWMLGDGRTT